MEDKAYTDLMISLTERIFKKNYNYMLDAKINIIVIKLKSILT